MRHGKDRLTVKTHIANAMKLAKKQEKPLRLRDIIIMMSTTHPHLFPIDKKSWQNTVRTSLSTSPEFLCHGREKGWVLKHPSSPDSGNGPEPDTDHGPGNEPEPPDPTPSPAEHEVPEVPDWEFLWDHMETSTPVDPNKCWDF